MLDTATGNLSSTNDTITLPTGWRAPKFLMFTANSSVAKSIPTYKPIDFVLARFEYDGSGNRTTGRPDIWGVNATVIQFEKKADQTYPYHIMYYRALAALAGGNLTNFLTDTYPRLLMATCAFQAFEYLKDRENQIYWMKIAMSEIEAASVAGDLELSGADLEMEIEGDGYGG